MEAGGWVSQFKWTIPSILFFNICTRAQICIFAFLYIYYISCRLWKVCLQYLLQGLGVDAAFDQELKSLTILPAGLTCQDFLNFQTSATSQRKPTPLYLSIQFSSIEIHKCAANISKINIFFLIVRHTYVLVEMIEMEGDCCLNRYLWLQLNWFEIH